MMGDLRDEVKQTTEQPVALIRWRSTRKDSLPFQPLAFTAVKDYIRQLAKNSITGKVRRRSSRCGSKLASASTV